MSTLPDWMRDVAVPTLKTGKRVLAVEGDDDKKVYRSWLEKLAPRGPSFTDRLVIVDAGGRDQVLQGLIWYRDLATPPSGELFGLVDRDEWDAEAVAAKQAAIPRLLVNERRHCVESYFIDPSQIEAALLAKNDALYRPHIPAIRGVIESECEAWVDHWALWVTMCRVSRRLSEELFPGHFHDQVPLPNDAEIEDRLQAWAGIVDAGATIEAFRQVRDAARARPAAEQFRGCIHAKKFLTRVVVPNTLTSSRSARREAMDAQTCEVDAHRPRRY